MTGLAPITVSPSRRPHGRPVYRQAGAATLAVAVIMLLVVSVLVFHSHTAGWLEQRATANQTRAKQAHAAAEAGLDVALSVLNADTAAPGDPARATHLTPDANQPGRFTILNNTLTGSPGGGLAYSVAIERVDVDALPYSRLRLSSRGGSDCTSLADVETCSGQAIVRQVIEVARILRNPSASPVSFESVFGASRAAIKSLTTPISSGAGLNASTTGLVWNQDDLVLTGPVGSPQNPVLLVVEGKLTVAAGGAITGFVHVTGDLICSGCSNPSIQGAVAVEGINNPPVNATPDATVLSRLDNTASRFAKVIGTWRDW